MVSCADLPQPQGLLVSTASSFVKLTVGIRRSSILGESGEAQVRLDNANVGEDLLGLLGLDAGVDNDIVTRGPVDGSGDLVLVAGLEGVDDAEDLGAVAAGGGGVRQDGADRLLGVDDEDGADGEGNALGVDVGGVLVVDHVVKVGDLAVLVADDGEADVRAGDLLDVADPALVALGRVGRESNQLDAALCELGLETSHLAELCGAHRGEILGVGEEDNPLVANELMEVNGALGGLGLEVGGNAAKTETGSDRDMSANPCSFKGLVHRASRSLAPALIMNGGKQVARDRSTAGKTYGAARSSAILKSVNEECGRYVSDSEVDV